MGPNKSAPQELDAAHCMHCGRIWIRSKEEGSDDCSCGAELYPVCKRLTAGELKLGDGYTARVLEAIAEKEGFEPPVDLHPRRLSKPVP